MGPHFPDLREELDFRKVLGFVTTGPGFSGKQRDPSDRAPEVRKIGRAQLGNPKQSENRNELVTEMQSHLVLKFADKAKWARFSHKLLCCVTETIVEGHQ